MSTEAISTAIPSGAHGTTFGASPLACRAAIVTLRALRERDLYARSAALGAQLMERLTSLGSPKVRQVRGRGMMIGVELKERVTPTLRALQEHGVLSSLRRTHDISPFAPAHLGAAAGRRAG